MNKIKKIRAKIDKLDKKLLKVLAKRFLLSKRIGKIKEKKGIYTKQPEREKQIMKKVLNSGRKYMIEKEFTEKIFKLVLRESRKKQE